MTFEWVAPLDWAKTQEFARMCISATGQGSILRAQVEGPVTASSKDQR
jgi:hypothetical protein